MPAPRATRYTDAVLRHVPRGAARA